MKGEFGPTLHEVGGLGVILEGRIPMIRDMNRRVLALEKGREMAGGGSSELREVLADLAALSMMVEAQERAIKSLGNQVRALDRRLKALENPSGASPAEVEEAVLRRIEEKVAGLAGIKRIDSNAQEGYGAVTIEVIKNWDLKKLLEEVKAEVDRITTLPDEAEKPVVRELTRKSRVINVAIYGNAREATIKQLAEKIKDEITNLPGITLADMRGIRTAEISIEISEETLRRHGLTLGQVASIPFNRV